jgi:hypothetical protein
MKFGFLKFLLLAIVLIVGGGFAWLALTDLPLHQQEITVNVPIGSAQ